MPTRVFSRDVVLGGGGNCFCGERKCEEYPKKKRNSLLFGVEIQNLGGGGGISPPKGPEKSTDANYTVNVQDLSLYTLQQGVPAPPILQLIGPVV